MQNALFVTRNFPPLAGGMERLNLHAYHALRNVYSTTVCGPKGAGAFVRHGDVCAEVPVMPLHRFLLGCQWQSLRLARRARPEVVYSGSGLTAPAALMAGRATKARVVSFLHGLDIVADHPLYQRVFLPAIRRCDRLLVNSRHTAGLAAAAGVCTDKIRIVHPGVSLPDWGEREKARQEFRLRHGCAKRPILLSVGRLTGRKGLREFVINALPDLLRAIPDLLLVIVGEEPSQALKHTTGVADGIRQAIQQVGAGENVRLLGRVDDSSLTQALFAADMLVFPVLDIPGDIEGFGMVAIEAAAHGLPTVAFSVGGVSEAVGDGVSGWLVPPGDYRHMLELIVGYLRGLPGNKGVADACHTHAREFAWEQFEKRLISSLSDA